MITTMACFADVYMSVDKKGTITYSDTPTEIGAIKLPFAEEKQIETRNTDSGL